MGDMTTFSPLHGPQTQRTGSTAVGDTHPRHLIGDALRALRVFASTAFSVAVLGEYAGHERDLIEAVKH